MRGEQLRIHRGIVSVCTVLLVVFVCAEAPDATAPLERQLANQNTAPDSSVENATQRLVAARLENGLRLVVVEDFNTGVVNVLHYLGVGSGNEEPHQAGIAHLLEHLMVGDWDHDTSGDRELELRALDRNARTSFASTVYETRCLPGSLQRVLELESRRLTTFQPPQVIVEREAFVVREEAARGDRFGAFRDLHDEVLRAAFVGHPYGRRIVGTDSTIAAITREDLQSFHRAHVASQNITLVIHGPVRYADLLPVVEATHGRITPNPDFEPVQEPPAPERERATVAIDRHDVENMSVCIGFRLPATSKEHLLLGLLVRHLLSGPGTGVSLTALPREWFMTFAKSWLYPDDPGDLSPDRMRQYAWNAIWRHIDDRRRLASRPDSFEVFRERAIQRIRHSADFARLLGPVLLFQEDPSWIAERDSIIRAFPLAAVEDYMQRWFVPQYASSGVVHGRKSRRPIQLDAASLNRNSNLGRQAPDPHATLTAAEIAPALASIRTAPRPRMLRHTLGNGIPLFSIAYPGEHAIEIGGVKTQTYLKHAEKKPGLVRFYDLVIDSDPKPNARAWKPLRHGVRFQVTSQSLSFDGTGEPQRIGRVAEALVERMTKREFNVATWRLVRDYAPTYLRPRNGTLDLEARVQRWSALLGEEHPVLGQWRGDPGDVKKWKYDHLRDMHKNVMQTGNLRLIATGSFDTDSLVREFESTFGRIECARPRDRWEDARAVATSPFVTVVAAFDRRDSRITFTFRPLSHAETANDGWAAIEVLRACIRARVYSRLRNREGLSYTVTTALRRAGDSVILELHASTFPAASERALRAMHEELHKLVGEGVSDDLLAQAQLSLARHLLLSWNDPEDAFEILQTMALYGDPVEDPIEAVLRVDRARCESLLRTCVDPKLPIVSICGPILEEESDTLSRALDARE